MLPLIPDLSWNLLILFPEYASLQAAQVGPLSPRPCPSAHHPGHLLLPSFLPVGFAFSAFRAFGPVCLHSALQGDTVPSCMTHLRTRGQEWHPVSSLPHPSWCLALCSSGRSAGWATRPPPLCSSQPAGPMRRQMTGPVLVCSPRGRCEPQSRAAHGGSLTRVGPSLLSVLPYPQSAGETLTPPSGMDSLSSQVAALSWCL